MPFIFYLQRKQKQQQFFTPIATTTRKNIIAFEHRTSNPNIYTTLQINFNLHSHTCKTTYYVLCVRVCMCVCVPHIKLKCYCRQWQTTTATTTTSYLNFIQVNYKYITYIFKTAAGWLADWLNGWLAASHLPCRQTIIYLNTGKTQAARSSSSSKPASH